MSKIKKIFETSHKYAQDCKFEDDSANIFNIKDKSAILKGIDFPMNKRR